MAELETIISALRTKWNKAKLPTHEVKKSDLEAAKSKFPGLTSDYLQTLKSVGLPDSEDARGFRFWGVDALDSAAAVLSSSGCPSTPDAEEALVFADYLQESWWYALWISGQHLGKVSLVLGTKERTHGDPLPPLGTFRDFLKLYISDDDRLYPPL